MRMRVDICIKCIKKVRGNFTRQDRDMLADRQIVCPYHDTGGEMKEPPEQCPYRLEHVIDSNTPNNNEYLDVHFEKGENGIFVPRT